MMNGVGRWRCSLGWIAIYTVMRTSLIIHVYLRQVTGKKRTSTFSSRHIVSDSRIYGSIFKNCLPNSTKRSSDDIIFTINFTRS
jgi:hypothetical protein